LRRSKSTVLAHTFQRICRDSVQRTRTRDSSEEINLRLGLVHASPHKSKAREEPHTSLTPPYAWIDPVLDLYSTLLLSRVRECNRCQSKLCWPASCALGLLFHQPFGFVRWRRENWPKVQKRGYWGPIHQFVGPERWNQDEMVGGSWWLGKVLRRYADWSILDPC